MRELRAESLNEVMWTKAKIRARTFAPRQFAVISATALCSLLLGANGAALASDGPDDTAPSARKSNAWSTKTLTKRPTSLNLDMSKLEPTLPINTQDNDVAGINPVLKNALFNLPTDTTAPLFKLDLSGGLCLDTSTDCAQNDIRSLDLGYTRDFAKDGIRGIDLALTPRAGMHYDDDSSSALVGALVKIGDNLKSDGGIDSNTWYLFAGADAQAVTYTPGSGARQLYGGNFSYQDHIIVGDAQAGVAYRIGDADLSLTYLRREARAENYKFEEDAAALSLTWRR